MIKIVVDSTCDLPEELMESNDIKSLPLRVSLNDREYLDKVTIQVDDVYAAMRQGVIPKTSQPNPGDMYALFKDYCIKGYDFIYTAFSSKLSCTYQQAISIISELKGIYPKVKMEVMDSKGGSTATGLIALQAARMVSYGLDFENVAAQAKKLIDHVEHVFTIADLNWLIKGGRISRGEGMIGNILDIKPILDVKDGLIEVIKKVRGRKKALSTVVDIVVERLKYFPNQILGISHADDLSSAMELYDMISKRVGETSVIINKIGSVLGSHLGIGGVGVFFFNMKPDFYFE